MGIETGRQLGSFVGSAVGVIFGSRPISDIRSKVPQPPSTMDPAIKPITARVIIVYRHCGYTAHSHWEVPAERPASPALAPGRSPPPSAKRESSHSAREFDHLRLHRRLPPLGQ